MNNPKTLIYLIRLWLSKLLDPRVEPSPDWTLEDALEQCRRDLIELRNKRWPELPEIKPPPTYTLHLRADFAPLLRVAETLVKTCNSRDYRIEALEKALGKAKAGFNRMIREERRAREREP